MRIALAALLLLLALPAYAHADKSPFIGAYPQITVETNHDGVIHGPGAKAKRHTATFDVYVDDKNVFPQSFEDAANCEAIYADDFTTPTWTVEVNGCGRVLKATINSTSGTHRVELIWSLEPRAVTRALERERRKAARAAERKSARRRDAAR